MKDLQVDVECFDDEESTRRSRAMSASETPNPITVNAAPDVVLLACSSSAAPQSSVGAYFAKEVKLIFIFMFLVVYEIV